VAALFGVCDMDDHNQASVTLREAPASLNRFKSKTDIIFEEIQQELEYLMQEDVETPLVHRKH